jgi:hypothetical protein
MRCPALPLAALAFALAIPAHAAAQDYYSDVRPMLVENCVGCHNDAGIGWSMEDAEATYDEHHRMIARAVTAEMMPPWLADKGHREYLGDLSLSDEVIGMVSAWRDAGFPKGEARPDPAPREITSYAFNSDLSIEVLPGEAYMPRRDMDDDYRCFVVDWTRDDLGYVTGFRAVPGNDVIAHHVVVHVVEPHMVERFKEIDEMVDGPGYECFGGALPSSFDWNTYEAKYPNGARELSQGEWWFNHWAPGMYGNTFPEGTGIPVKPGSALVVQMHYYSKEAPDERDVGSVVEFEVVDQVERPAFLMVNTKNAWFAGARNESMVIPSGELTTYSVTETLSDYVGLASSVTGIDRDKVGAFEIYSANLHMHAFGHSGDITLTDENGRTETLLEISDYNLHWQRDFPFKDPVIFDREVFDATQLRLRCTYENDTGDIVYGGYGSYDEMCMNMSYVAVQPVQAATEENGSNER